MGIFLIRRRIFIRPYNTSVLIYSCYTSGIHPTGEHKFQVPSFVTKAVTSAGDFAEKSGRTAKTISAHSGYRERSKRKDSRTILFIRLRFTAPLSLRWTLIPIRLYPKSLGQKISEKPFACQRVPFRYTFSNSRPLRSKAVFGSLNLGKVS